MIPIKQGEITNSKKFEIPASKKVWTSPETVSILPNVIYSKLYFTEIPFVWKLSFRTNLVASTIRTRIVRVEGEDPDH